jgi:hypothetical protein
MRAIRATTPRKSRRTGVFIDNLGLCGPSWRMPGVRESESFPVGRQFFPDPIPWPCDADVECTGAEDDPPPAEFCFPDSEQPRMAQICARKSPRGIFSEVFTADTLDGNSARGVLGQDIWDGDAHISAAIARIGEEIEAARLALPEHDCDPADVDKLRKTYVEKREKFYNKFLHRKFFKGLKQLDEGQIRGTRAAAYAPEKCKLNEISMLLDYKSILRRGDNFHKCIADKLLRLWQMADDGGENIYSELLRDGFTEEYAEIYKKMRREILADSDCLGELENICWRSYDSFPAATAGLMDAFYQLCEKLFGADTYDYRLLFSGYFRNYSNRKPNGGSHKFGLFQSLAHRARVAGEDAYYWGMLRNLSHSKSVAAEVYGADEERLFGIFTAMHALTTVVLDLCDVPGKSADGKKITLCRMEGSDLIGKHGAAGHIRKNEPGEGRYVKHLPLICGSLGGNSQLVGRKITIYRDIPLHRIYSGYFLEDDILGRFREVGISFFGEGLEFFHIGNLRGKNRKHGPIVRYDESYDELFDFPKATHRLDSDGNKVFTPFGALKFLKDNLLKKDFPGKEFLDIEIGEESGDKWRKAAWFLGHVRKNLPPTNPQTVKFRESCDVLLNFACGKFMEKPTLERAFAHACHHYRKQFPPYEEVRVMREGQVEYFSQLAPKIQLQLLREGIRGNGGRRTLNEIEKMLSRPEDQWDLQKLTQLMQNALHVTPGGTSRVHSALHGARAAIFVEIFANIYRRLFKEFENLSDEDIYKASIAALFHDSGREAEGIDVFEELSAQNARDYLFQCGFSEDFAEEVRQIVLHKDAPVSTKDPVAVLLHEADCIEYLRLSHFDPRYLDVYGGTGQSNRLAFTPLDHVGEKEARKTLTHLVEVAKGIIRGQAPTLEDFTGEKAYADLRAGMVEKTRHIWEELA